MWTPRYLGYLINSSMAFIVCMANFYMIFILLAYWRSCRLLLAFKWHISSAARVRYHINHLTEILVFLVTIHYKLIMFTVHIGIGLYHFSLENPLILCIPIFTETFICNTSEKFNTHLWTRYQNTNYACMHTYQQNTFFFCKFLLERCLYFSLISLISILVVDDWFILC